jgi:signal transduction histidine kinase
LSERTWSPALVAAALVAVGAGLGFAPMRWLSSTTPSSAASVQTALAGVALLAAYLLFGRFRQRRMLRDLALCFTVALLAAKTLTFGLLPAIAGGGGPPDHVVRAAAASLEIVIAAGFALCARAGGRRAEPSGMQSVDIAVIAAVALGVAVAAGWAAQQVAALAAAVVPLDAGWSSGAGLAVPLLIVVGCYGVAAVAFLRRAYREQDELLLWLAAASALAAETRLVAVVRVGQAEPTQGLLTLRLLVHLALLVGAARELSRTWHTAARSAVLEERQRIARNLHDGLSQELAFVAAQSAIMVRDSNQPARAERVQRAAERALDESRTAIAVLSRRRSEPFVLSLTRAVEDAAARVGTRIDVDVEPVEPEHHLADALLRIAREAVLNAGRHGRAPHVSVELRRSPRDLLTVRDDGVGFDPVHDRVRPGGFGLISMRERAAAVGAELVLESAPHHGTVVTVRCP